MGFSQSREDIARAYTFYPLSAEAREKAEEVRDRFRGIALYVHDNVPEGRARSVALTEIQTAKMYAVQAVVDADEG